MQGADKFTLEAWEQFWASGKPTRLEQAGDAVSCVQGACLLRPRPEAAPVLLGARRGASALVRRGVPDRVRRAGAGPVPAPLAPPHRPVHGLAARVAGDLAGAGRGSHPLRCRGPRGAAVGAGPRSEAAASGTAAGEGKGGAQRARPERHGATGVLRRHVRRHLRAEPGCGGFCGRAVSEPLVVSDKWSNGPPRRGTRPALLCGGVALLVDRHVHGPAALGALTGPVAVPPRTERREIGASILHQGRSRMRFRDVAGPGGG